MKLLFAILSFTLLLQGCSTTPAPPVEMAKVVDVKKAEQKKQEEKLARESDDYLYYYVAHSFSRSDITNAVNDQNKEQSGVQTESNGYGHQYSFNGEKSLILSEVVSKMADQLLYNYGRQYHDESIALTSLVDLNNHQVTNWLGQTISEQFIHELHIRKLRVVDFKQTGNIQVTENGEFAMTRDWKKLNKNVDVTRILTGTMSRNEEGVILNIRIVNANNGIVESTSSAFIPHNMFVGGHYDYYPKQYISRNSNDNGNSVRLVK
ncbi:FlgO family outer membrane protein [Psychromonas sp.]|nr:FlgO family outer membrane protein [Psychromonas sp.]